MMPHLIIALWHGSSCTLGNSVFVRGWAHRVAAQTNSSRNLLHQPAWNRHICDVFEPTQAHLFFLLPPSTAAPSALPLFPILQLCATSSRRTLCTNTHSALLSLKITSQTEKTVPFCLRMVPFRVYEGYEYYVRGKRGCLHFYPIFSLLLLIFLPHLPLPCHKKNNNFSLPSPLTEVWIHLEKPSW